MSALLGSRVPAAARPYRRAWWTIYVTGLACGLAIAAVARRQIFEPYLGVSLGLIALLLLGWLLGPRPTLYAMLTLTAISDLVTVSWFPFAKNLSSRESIAFVADAATLSPLDAMIAAGALTSVIRQYAWHRRLIAPSRVTPVVVAFAAFVAYGFANGVAGGAPLRIAVIESRPVWYVGAVFVIAANELQTTQHFRYALWALVAGVTIQSILSIDYYVRLPLDERSELEGLNEHGSALGHNMVILATLLIVLVGMRMGGRGIVLAIAAIPTLVVYVLSQRRAGFGALVIALILTAIVLFWHRRRAFWTLVPLGSVLLLGYTLAFWNSTGAAGFAAQAVKSIVAPDQASAADQSSDLYRMIEGYDLWFTIRASPLRGLGFGHAFYRPVPLPAITDFELASYMPHNSLLWVWVKLGFLGFVAMFAMFGRALMVAAERIRTLPLGQDLFVHTIAAGFVAMFAVFTWYDISWDARNTVFLGVMLAICGHVAQDDADDDDDAEPTMTVASRSA